MSDKEIYQLIADELEAKDIDAALWTKAKEAAVGDPDKTEAIYIKLRFSELVKSSLPAPMSTSLVISANNALAVKPAVDDLARMRTELAMKLLYLKKHNLYSTLGLHPDASDALIATAISDLESRNSAGTGIDPAEFKYAKETLSNPGLREQYDRQLFETISSKITHSDRSLAIEGMNHEYSWWESRKTSIVIAVLSLAILGYLGINYLKVRNSSEIQKISVESQKEVLEKISNAAQMKAQTDVEASRLVAERQNQEMELRNRATERMYDDQRAMQESRNQAEQQRQQAQKEQTEKRLKDQQEQAENLRIAREKRYWECMNMQMSQGNIATYDANARCAMYR